MNQLIKTLNRQEPELRRLIDLFDAGHDAFQMEHFIINANGITAYGKFKQCVLEIQTRYFNIKRGLLELDEHRLNQQQLQTCRPQVESDAALNQLQIRKLAIDVEQQEVSLKTQLRELNTFVGLAKALESEIDWDNEPEQIKEFWHKKLTHQMTTALMWNNNQVQAVMNFVSHMPEQTRQEFVQNAMRAVDAINDLSQGNPQSVHALLDNQDTPAIP